MILKRNDQVDKNLRELEIVVEKDEMEKAIETAYRKNVGKIAVPGFRKGKAPRKIIEKYYGEGVFFEDAVNIAYPEAYEKALEETGIEPVDKAEVEMKDGSDEGFTFIAKVTVKPEVIVKEYKGLSAEKPSAEVTEEEIDEEVKRLQTRNSRLVTVEREAKDGDATIIDYSGSVDGVKFEGGTAENQTLNLGSGMFIPGFEEQVVGMKAGDEKDITVKFPEEYHAKDLAGKVAIFHVKLHEVKETEMPTVDDEFVKDVSEFDTVADFRADIQKKIAERKEKMAETEFENGLMDALIENMEAEIPQCMIESQIDDIARDFDYKLKMQGLDLGTYLSYSKMDMSSFRRTFEEQATKQVKSRLALEKVAELENIDVPDEDAEAELKRLSEYYGMALEEVKKVISAASVKKDLAVAKVVDLIKENAKTLEKKVKKATKKATTKKEKAEEQAEEKTEE